MENIFYIIDLFQIIHEINICYSFENIYDLNVQNLQNLEDNEEIGNLEENVNELKINDLESQLKKINELTNTKPTKKKIHGEENTTLREKSKSEKELENDKNSESSESDNVPKRSHTSKEKNENDAKSNKNNTVKFF